MQNACNHAIIIWCHPDKTESAKALHGRNTPLQNGAYINLFTHYRPLNDPDWYLRPNPEGTPEPLMDVGECRLAGAMDQYSQNSVVCENSAIGPHLSPTMFQAKSGNDLFQWWKSVGPQEEDEFRKEGSGGGEELWWVKNGKACHEEIFRSLPFSRGFTLSNLIVNKPRRSCKRWVLSLNQNNFASTNFPTSASFSIMLQHVSFING